MIDTPPVSNRHRARRRWMIGAAAGAAALLAAGAAVGVAGYLGAFHTITAADLVTSDARIHPVESTASLCDESLPCVEAWRTDVGDYLRFGSVGEAEYWEVLLGDDGRRWKNIVLDLRAARPGFEEQRYAIDALFSYRDWN
ncbi:hypothetical protein [Zhihengliuella halotolerans]|uniref:Uncharacterized protein n=1 Tax=Zhihengliuella halotolerans TaxID=370736 RepID=A0A4Q8AEY4_9MICC|nr:hypothetical protein [Zhihengliuella halotolerans]RZU62285.1 hypothetical protein EV380_1878 [Zhihengliuella halotolerans]